MPATASHQPVSRWRLARQLTVLMALLVVLAGTSSRADAMLCEVETAEAQLMSTVEAQLMSWVSHTSVSLEDRALAWAKVVDAEPYQACDPLSMDDCDINLPGGQPTPPNPASPLRPSAACSHQEGHLPIPPRARPLYEEPAGALLTGHVDELFRPPRS